MFYLIVVLIIIICLLLVLVVLVQNSKGGGLSSSFGSSNHVMGVRKTSDFLEKATWSLAIGLLMLSLVSNFVVEKREAGLSAEIEEMLRDQPEVDAPASYENP